MPYNPGQNIGDYEVISHLGAGGIGEVYKVRHIISQRTEAVKFLRSDRKGGELPERFLREIRVLASLSHPNIARLHNAFRIDDQTAMVMEFIEGEELHWKLRSPWTRRAPEGLEYIRQVLSALDYAHARGIIHRDIKPSNIMITGEGQAKLLDFGLAFTTADHAVTRPGFVVGSLHYMSPEQVRGERVDLRSDIYSTGVTLYEILVGRRPFDGTSEYDVMTGHLTQEARWPSELNPAIPQAVSASIMRAMAKNPAERFQTASDFLHALSNLSMDDAMTLETLAIEPEDLPLVSLTPVKPASLGTPLSRPGGAAKARTGGLFDPAMLDSVSRELAVFIGPIAKVVVKRAASQCSSLDDLYSKVAAEIDSEKDRSAFLSRKKR
jgi:serine/threonine-protein kinase